ncbi:class I SAM-dependent methyltransferase [Planctomycetota bacterium]
MQGKVCPVWVGYILASPIRRLLQNPKRILGPYIKEGMNVLDIGSAMGFFSLPLARMVGTKGKVICVDLQEKMLASLNKRARKASMSERIETRMSGEKSLGLTGLENKIDFALASAVVHEVPDAGSFFSEVHNALKPHGQLLIIEPRGHVSQVDFDITVNIAQKIGFEAVSNPSIKRSFTVLFKKILKNN